MTLCSITGGAGFIGSNLVHHALAHTDRPPRHRRQADLRRQPAQPRGRARRSARDVRRRRTSPIARRWRACSPTSQPRGRAESGRRDARRSLDRQPAAVHRHQHRRHVRAARDGARSSWPASPAPRARRSAFCTCRPTRSTARSGPIGPVQRGDAVRAELAVRGEQGVGRSPGARLLPHLRPAGAHHELLEQLRAVSVSGEADPADDPERARRPAAADLRRRRQRPRLAARRRSLRRAFCWCSRKGAPGEKYNIGGGNERTQPRRSSIVICDALDELRPAAANPALAGSRSSYRALKTFVPDRPGHDRRYAIDATKIRASSAGRRATRSRTGLRETVGWYLEHRDWCEAVQAGRYDRERLGLGIDASRSRSTKTRRLRVVSRDDSR